jgi:hypothetical protein
MNSILRCIPSRPDFIKLIYIISLIVATNGEEFKLISENKVMRVYPGNYTHYTLREPGNLKIVLTTIIGDADLYITNKHHYADYLNYDFQSISYGTEEISIKDDYKRPISIAVYAHPYYPTTSFILSVYSVKYNKIEDQSLENDDFSHYTYSDFYNEDLAGSEILNKANYDDNHRKYQNDHKSNNDIHNKKSYSQYENVQDQEQQEGESDEKENIFWTIFIHLLEFIAEVLL